MAEQLQRFGAALFQNKFLIQMGSCTFSSPYTVSADESLISVSKRKSRSPDVGPLKDSEFMILKLKLC